MTVHDLQAAVTAWVAQELETQAPGEDLGYWVTILGPDTALPRVAIIISAGEYWSMQCALWPPGDHRIRLAVRKALEELEEIARAYRDRAAGRDPGL